MGFQDILCRIAVFEHFENEAILMLQVQWYGINQAANETRPKWHFGKMEKVLKEFKFFKIVNQIFKDLLLP